MLDGLARPSILAGPQPPLLEAAYAAVADPATLDRVLRDREDGLALGVQGTPTFFLNGEKLEVDTTDEFIERIDAALAG